MIVQSIRSPLSFCQSPVFCLLFVLSISPPLYFPSHVHAVRVPEWCHTRGVSPTMAGALCPRGHVTNRFVQWSLDQSCSLFTSSWSIRAGEACQHLSCSMWQSDLSCGFKDWSQTARCAGLTSALMSIPPLQSSSPHSAPSSSTSNKGRPPSFTSSSHLSSPSHVL